MHADRAALLRIYTDQNAQVGDRAVFNVIVERAYKAGLAGATVLRGRSGFGHGLHMHADRLVELDANLPMVVEIVDDEDKVRSFTTAISGLHGIGLITLERVEILRS